MKVIWKYPFLHIQIHQDIKGKNFQEKCVFFFFLEKEAFGPLEFQYNVQSPLNLKPLYLYCEYLGTVVMLAKCSGQHVNMLMLEPVQSTAT